MSPTYTVKVTYLDFLDADYIFKLIMKAGFNPSLEKDGEKE